MNRINELFKKEHKNILSIYFCAGYPILDNTQEIIKSLEKHGVKMVEIGIPFSDPMADGPVIQEASTQALRNGMSLRLLFGQLENIRKEVNIPLILMGYLNPIMQFGFENFCLKCQETGIDGVIIPDLPFKDYMQHYKSIAERHNLKIIMLITPETSEPRIREIDKNTDGFIYMVSSAGITGEQKDFNSRKKDYFKKIAEMKLKNPHMVGFGISNKQTLDAATEYAEGAIIGSKFVKALKNHNGNPDEAIEEVLKALETA